MNEQRTGYTIGYVGVIDVLGFGRFSQDETNFSSIHSLMESIFYQKSNFERNFEHIKFTLLSDTVVVMIEANESRKFDYVYLQSVLANISLIRSFILDCTGLYSRAGVTFGKYYHDEQTGTIFGPAITRAAGLAEKSDEFITTDHRFICRPASILVDEVFSKKEGNPFHKCFLDGGIIDYLSNANLSRIKHSLFYIYNPYFEAYQDYLLCAAFRETNLSDDKLFDAFCKRERERINNQMNLAGGELAKKYSIEIDMLASFVSNHKQANPSSAQTMRGES